MPRLSIIVPCFNEAENIPLFFAECEKVRAKIADLAQKKDQSLGQSFDFEYIFVNDGSDDETLEVLRKLQTEHEESVHYLSFSRNFGKEAALYAGLQAATGDLISLMDADLQDPPELLLEMLEKIQEPDLDCVAARRSDRSGEPWLTSLLSRFFYRLMNHLSSVPMLSGVRDYRLMTRQMLNAILELAEYNRFSKGLFSWVGFNTDYVEYPNNQRKSGRSKWSLTGKIRYALDAFINFSDAPLNLAIYSGLLAVFLDMLALIYVIVRRLLYSDPVQGWASTIVVILFAFGVLLTMLGVIGKYISKIFLEVKKRPIYIIKEKK